MRSAALDANKIQRHMVIVIVGIAVAK